jgi:hypothetical protein
MPLPWMERCIVIASMCRNLAKVHQCTTDVSQPIQVGQFPALEDLAMTKSPLLPGLLFCLCLFSLALPALPQTGRNSGDNGDDPVAKLQRAGWKIVQDGVLQRQARPQEIETFVFGAEGFTRKLRDLRSQLQFLRKEFEAKPTPELRRAIASHRKAIASTLEMIEKARAAEASGEPILPKTDCTVSFPYDAVATYKTDRQGTRAEASATFSSTPGCNFTGEVYAYAFAKATVGGAPTTATVTDGPRSGANVTAGADANRNGGSHCESYAYASVTSNNLNPSSYSKSQSNSICPSPAPLQAAVSSDRGDQVDVAGDLCLTITWTVNISGGTPGYSSSIYRDGVFVASGTTYESESFCGSDGGPASITIDAYVTDSSGHTASASHTTELFYGTNQCRGGRPYCG